MMFPMRSVHPTKIGKRIEQNTGNQKVTNKDHRMKRKIQKMCKEPG